MQKEVSGLVNPTLNAYTADNIYSLSKYKYLSALDIVKWVNSQNCMAIPCQPRKKKPILDICQHKILDSGFEYGLFDDSYHIASEKRIQWINDYWKRWFNIVDIDSSLIAETLPNKMSIALNTGNGWNNQQFLSVIDIDDAKYISEFDIELFKDCPRVYGKSGVKLLFFSEGDIIQGDIINGENHIIDLYFSVSRLIFIYGEHPSSTPENPIYYRLDELKEIPTIDREKVISAIKEIVINNGLKLKLEKEKLATITQPKINRYGNCKPTLNKWSKLRLSDVISFNKTIIEHPVHGAEHGGNTSLNLSDDTWYCFRHHVGGGVIELIAVVEGIVECDEVSSGMFEFGDKNMDKWLKLKKVLEDKYGVDVFGYEIAVRKWYLGNKKQISDLWDGEGNVR